jgi:hypothetical protein
MGAPSLSRRAYAVNAISGFREVGISYSSLVQEPIFDEDDKHLLRQLYQEAGIATEHQSSATNTASNQSETVQRTVSTDPQLRDLMSRAGISLDESFSDPSMGRQPNSGTSRAITVSRPLPGLSSNGKENVIPGLNQKSLSQTTSLVPQPLSSPSDPTVPPPATATSHVQSTQHNEAPLSNEAKRQLFLARLKAAKSKKSGASSGSPAPSQAQLSVVEIAPTTNDPMLATALPKGAADTAQPTRAANQPSTVVPIIPSIARKEPSSVVRVNNAELHRRMESMREKAAALSAKSRPAMPSRSTSMSSIDYSQGRDSDASESVQSVGDSSQATPRAMPSSSDFGVAGPIASPQTQSRPSIPGLFMAEPAARTQPPTQPAITSPYVASPVPVSQLPVAPSSQPAPQSHLPGYQHASVQYSPARNSTAYASPGFHQYTNTMKRPASASSGPIRFGAPKRPYGYRPYTTHDEQVVIDISSDEDEEGSDVMDLDEDDAGPQFSRPPPPATRHPLPQRPPAAANNLPSRPNFNGRPFQPSFSTPSSTFPTPPAAQTPNPLDIQRQHAAIEQERKKLQEQLNKKLQEKKKGRDGTTASPSQATPKLAANTLLPLTLTETASLSGTPRPGSSAGFLQPILSDTEVPPTTSTSQISSSPALSSPLLASAQTIPRQTKLRSTVSAVPSRNEKIEMLRKRQKELEEETRRQKQELEEEIRLLGIDTEGMTHEEMQVAKDDLLDAPEDATEQDDPEPEVGPSAAPKSPVVTDPLDEVEHTASDEEEGEIFDSTQAFALTRTDEPQVPRELPKPDNHVLELEEPQVMDLASPESPTIVVADTGLHAASHLEQEEIVDTDDDVDPDEIDEALNMISSSTSGSDSDESVDYEPEIGDADQNAADVAHATDDGSSLSESSSVSESEVPLDIDPEGEAGTTDIESDQDSDRFSEDSETYKPIVTSVVQADTNVTLERIESSEDFEMSEVYDNDSVPSANAMEERLHEILLTDSKSSLEDQTAGLLKQSSPLREESRSEATTSVPIQPVSGHQMDDSMGADEEMFVDEETADVSSAEIEESMHFDGDEDEQHDLGQMATSVGIAQAEQEVLTQLDDNEDGPYEPEQPLSIEDTATSEPDASIQPENGVPLPGMYTSIAGMKFLTKLHQTIRNRSLISR